MPKNTLAALHIKLSALEKTRAKMESLFNSGQINNGDIDIVYEALFLRVVTGFEQFCDDLFFNILSRKKKYRHGRVSLRIKTDLATFQDILQARGDKKYLDWLPFKYAVERANLFLKDGKPFSEVDNGVKSTMKTIVAVRNAIAHSSSHATKEFKNAVNHDPATGELTPAMHLRTTFRSSPSQNRFQNYVGELGAVAAVLH